VAEAFRDAARRGARHCGRPIDPRVERRRDSVGAIGEIAQPLAQPGRVDGIRVDLQGTARVGATSDLTFHVTDAATGRPLDDLQPYLAAAGHVVIMRGDGQTFAHEHADVRDSDGNPVFALPGQTFGPDLPVHVHFDTAGTYRLWAQFRLADGAVVTAPFTVQAR